MPAGSSARLIARIDRAPPDPCTSAQLRPLELADPVFGRDRTAVSDDDRVDQRVDLAPARQERRLVRADRLRDVAVQVAVAEMAERHEPRAGHGRQNRRPGLGEEGGDARHRHGDVVLDRAALALLHLGEQFAQRPEPLRLIDGGGERRVRHYAVFHCRLQQREQPGAEPLVGLAGDFQQHATTGAEPPAGRATRSRGAARCRGRAREISSKLRRPEPKTALARPSRSSAASGASTPTKAVSTDDAAWETVSGRRR